MFSWYTVFIDPDNGEDKPDLDWGYTFDTAYKTLQYAVDYFGFGVFGTFRYIVRRTLSLTLTAQWDLAYTEFEKAPAKIIGWPRGEHIISSSTWTQGQNTVVIHDNDMVRYAHEGRWVLAPDGNLYLITKVSASGLIYIDKSYIGDTMEYQSAIIQKDEQYDELHSDIDDSGWTIKKTDWDSDSESLPVINLNAGNYYININGIKYLCWENFVFTNGNSMTGIISVRYGNYTLFRGCIFYQPTARNILFCTDQHVDIIRCIFSGHPITDASIVIRADNNMNLVIKDSAIWGFHGYALQFRGLACIENSNFGVEEANENYNFRLAYVAKAFCKNCKIDDTNGDVTMLSASYPVDDIGVYSEDHQKTLGAQHVDYNYGTCEMVAVSEEPPNKLYSDNVLKISPNRKNEDNLYLWAWEIFKDEFDLFPGTYNFRYAIFNDALGNLNPDYERENLWFQIDYVKDYLDDENFISSIVYTEELNIANAADADDWYLINMPELVIPVLSRVTIKMFLHKYSASGSLYVDMENYNERWSSGKRAIRADSKKVRLIN